MMNAGTGTTGSGGGATTGAATTAGGSGLGGAGNLGMLKGPGNRFTELPRYSALRRAQDEHEHLRHAFDSPRFF